MRNTHNGPETGAVVLAGLAGEASADRQQAGGRQAGSHVRRDESVGEPVSPQPQPAEVLLDGQVLFTFAMSAQTATAGTGGRDRRGRFGGHKNEGNSLIVEYDLGIGFPRQQPSGIPPREMHDTHPITGLQSLPYPGAFPAASLLQWPPLWASAPSPWQLQ
jgi:hypothetical protein